MKRSAIRGQRHLFSPTPHSASLHTGYAYRSCYIPRMLPVESALPALLAALEPHNSAVLIAPPGAGKTTGVPPALLAAPWRGDQKIIVVEPRRLAARAAAYRIAELRGEPVGRTIGYRVRNDTKVSRDTRIELVTAGVFVRMILNDPALEGIAAVLFDEVHERAVD